MIVEGHLFRTKTFIVGAGASAEFGLPTGQRLVEKIEQICNLNTDDFGMARTGDRLMWNAFVHLEREGEGNWDSRFLGNVASKVRQNMGLAPSIDNFLDSKRGEEGWAEVGKLAIARAILSEERRSKLWFEYYSDRPRPDFSLLPQNWLTEVFRTLVAQKGKEEFRAALKSCRFINFNYDRIIEQFFHQAVKSYFVLSSEEADSLCADCLNVIHVYGCLGEVDCRSSSNFGNDDDVMYLIEAARRIKTFTEGVSNASHIARAKSWLETSEVLIFLGFGFLPLNLRVLAPDDRDFYSMGRFIGTCKGMSPDNLEIVRNLLQHEWYGGRDYSFGLEDVTGSELIWRHSLLLSEADRKSAAPSAANPTLPKPIPTQ